MKCTSFKLFAALRTVGARNLALMEMYLNKNQEIKAFSTVESDSEMDSICGIFCCIFSDVAFLQDRFPSIEVKKNLHRFFFTSFGHFYSVKVYSDIFLLCWIIQLNLLAFQCIFFLSMLIVPSIE